jgi:hypothetical protein
MTPTPTPTPTPTRSVDPCTTFKILTAVSTENPCATPFQSFQGETSNPTPPPTSTSGDGPTQGSTPLFAFLISLAFGGLGLAAVQAQRRSIRR